MPVDNVSLLLYFTSIASILGMVILAYGYRWSLYSNDAGIRWFARSVVLLAIAYVARRSIWDIAVPIFYDQHIEHPWINIGINLLSLAATYTGLQARLQLIDQHERHSWRWWTAWAHPKLSQIKPETRKDYDNA